MKNDEHISLKAASGLCLLGVDRLRVLVRQGRLTAVQPSGPGGKMFVLRSEIERMLEPVVSEGK